MQCELFRLQRFSIMLVFMTKTAVPDAYRPGFASLEK